ncbi:MAG: protein phosphatase 2C domain-containing protein [Peptostreptococcaceae bacterium]
MNYKIFECGVVGYKNIFKNLNSQDYLKCKVLQNAIIASVCDGHSGEFFKYSDIGAKLACESSFIILDDLINKNKEEILEKLQNQIIQKNIQDKWMNLVDENFKTNHPVVIKTPYLRYSTTLLSVLITKEFVLYLKIGDGDIVTNKKEKFMKVIKTKNKEIVDSLGRNDSYTNIMYKIEAFDENEFDNMILFTDGYENCFNNEDILYKNLESTINKYNKNIFSRMMLIKNYESYMSKLSKAKSKDDISIIFILKSK